jgi:hypothetical protein
VSLLQQVIIVVVEPRVDRRARLSLAPLLLGAGRAVVVRGEEAVIGVVRVGRVRVGVGAVARLEKEKGGGGDERVRGRRRPATRHHSTHARTPASSSSDAASSMSA